MKCQSCHKSTLRKANFCHNCGHKLGDKSTFNSAVDTPWTVTGSQSSTATDKMGLVTTTGLIWAMSLGGCWLADIDPAWSVVPGLVTLIGPTVAEAAYQWVTLPKPAKEHINKIQVEHVDEFSRPRALYDFNDFVTMEQLIFVANQLADGKPFSRRGLCAPGKFSQGDFYKLRDELFRLHYAFYKNPAIPNEGIVLTPRCQKLFKRVVDGG